jgi:hypothetical protein
MAYLDAPVSYDELWAEFKGALDRALAGAVLPPAFAMFDITVSLALLDVTYAARLARPTERLVTHAGHAFARYAADYDTVQASIDTTRRAARFSA